MRRPADLRTAILLVLLPAVLACAALACAAVAAPAATLAPQKQQVLVVNIGDFPTSVDPGKTSSTADFAVQNALFAPLYRRSAGSSGALLPMLAAKQPVVSADGLHYTITLRAARWSDGVAITAADVVAGYERAGGSYMAGFFTRVAAVSAVGARTVRIDLISPVPWFDQLLTSNVLTAVPSHAIKRYGTRWTKLANLVTSGPFLLASTRGRSELTLNRNPKWWGAKSVKLRQLVLRAVPEAAAPPLFLGRRLDATLADTSIRSDLLHVWRMDKRFRTTPLGRAQYLYMNTRNPELADARVRRGIALALDRAQLAQLTGEGIDRPLETIVPSGVRGADSLAPAGGTLLATSGAADAVRARQELANGNWVASRKLDLYYSSDGETASDVASAIVRQLAAVGVTVVAHPLPGDQFAKRGIGISPVSADVDLVLQGWAPDYLDPQNFHQLFTCPSIDAGLNAANYCDASYDTTFAAATAFAPFAERLTAHRALEESLTGPNGSMPAVPLVEPMGDYLVQPWVRGYSVKANGLVDFERVSITTH